MREMNPSIEFANKTGLAYGAACRPLCQELGLPQTAFDILMFLANNPGYKTASDIVEVRHIKANLVSVNVDKLVQEGLLERRPWHRVCRHERGSGHQPHAHHLPAHGSLTATAPPKKRGSPPRPFL